MVIRGQKEGANKVLCCQLILSHGKLLSSRLQVLFLTVKLVCGHVQSASTKEPLYLHCVAEVSSSSDSHHGQQTRSRPDVQDDDLLPTSLYPGHSGPDALVVLLILEAESTSAESMLKESENMQSQFGV